MELGATFTTPEDAEGDSFALEHESSSIADPAPPAAGTTPELCDPVIGCRGGYSVYVIPEVTLTDLASFTPARPSFTAEPDGAAIVGMPANFVASASPQSLRGELFGHPVTVHFAPAEYVFRYGDGASRVSATGGSPWSALGLPQFTATSTSHAYAERGTFTASVTVRYTASVDFDLGVTRDVAGFVEATTGGYDVQVYDVRTALVERTCLEDPRGPGC